MDATEGRRSERRADIDYLRVGALLLLIVYHVLLVYNSWDWWRVKSDYAGAWADYITGTLTPWRMATVFFIGGVAARFMIERSCAKHFIAERASKLLTAFLFAVIVLVPLQRYVRLDETGHGHVGYVHYLLHEARYAVHSFGFWLPDFAQAWFLPYLFTYSVAGVTLFYLMPRLAARLQRWTDQLPLWALIGSVMTLFAVVEAFILPRLPTTGLLIPDIGAHAKFAPLFLLGLLLGKSRTFTERLVAIKAPLWTCALGLLALVFFFKGGFLDYGEPTGPMNLFWLALRGAYGGAMLFGVLAFAAWALTRPTPVLAYATDAILPVYLMHQTVLVVVADEIVARHWPLPLEFVTLLSATALVPLLLYHTLIRNTPPLRVLFGLRPHVREPMPAAPVRENSFGHAASP